MAETSSTNEPTEAAAALRQPRTVSDEEIDAAARVHHDEYERLAAERGYDTREESRLPWDQLTPAMQRLMRDCERASIEAFLALHPPREGAEAIFCDHTPFDRYREALERIAEMKWSRNMTPVEAMQQIAVAALSEEAENG